MLKYYNNILYINTSIEYCIALYVKKKIKKIILNYNFSLKNLLYIINSLLEKNKTNINKINFIICINGPGNFISTRIGILSSIGLSLYNNIKIINISILDILRYIKNKYKKYIIYKKKKFFTIINFGSLFYFIRSNKINNILIYNYKDIINFIKDYNNNNILLLLYKSHKVINYINNNNINIKYININKINKFNIIYNIFIKKITLVKKNINNNNINELKIFKLTQNN